MGADEVRVSIRHYINVVAAAQPHRAGQLGGVSRARVAARYLGAVSR